MREKTIIQSLQTINKNAEIITHYNAKITDALLGKFDKRYIPEYQAEVDKAIERIISVRNSIVPLNQGIIAVNADELAQQQQFQTV